MIGIVLAFVLVRPRAKLILPSFLLVFGIATFLGLSIRGFAVINRYLVISALALTVFAAFTLGGWSVLRGRGRTVWAAARGARRRARRRLDRRRASTASTSAGSCAAARSCTPTWSTCSTIRRSSPGAAAGR